MGWAPIPPPEPIALPLPIGLLEALLVGSFAVHILAVDVAVGGTVIALVHYARGRRSGDRRHTELALGLSKTLPTAIALLINLGIPPLLFLQVLYGQAFYTSSVLLAVPWLLVVPALAVGYLAIYRLSESMAKDSPFALVLGVGGALLLLSIGFMLTNNVTLMLRPESWEAVYRASPHGFGLNLSEPTLLPRYAHMLLGMLAGAGAYLAVLSTLRAPPFDAAFARRTGLRWFVGATLLQLVVGPLFLFSQPPEIRGRFLGGSPVLSGVLWGAVLFALLAVGLALRGQDPRRGRAGVYAPVAAVGVTVLGMVTVRNAVRTGMLGEHGFSIHAQEVRPDWLTFSIFAAVLALGLVTIWKMSAWVRADLARSSDRPKPEA